jgi:hypothetical protein
METKTTTTLDRAARGWPCLAVRNSDEGYCTEIAP